MQDAINKLVFSKLGINVEMVKENGADQLLEGIYNSDEIAATAKNVGVLSAFFKAIQVQVYVGRLLPGEDFQPAELKVAWFHKTGGRNSDDMKLFYHVPTEQFLTREEAARIIELAKQA